MTYDIPRIRRVMKQIEAEPETLRMASYGLQSGCRTTFCLAGHTVLDEGLTMSWLPLGDGTQLAEALTDGRDIHEVAAQLLGFNEREADEIFLSVHVKTPTQLWGVIEEVTLGAVTEHDQA